MRGAPLPTTLLSAPVSFKGRGAGVGWTNSLNFAPVASAGLGAQRRFRWPYWAYAWDQDPASARSLRRPYPAPGPGKGGRMPLWPSGVKTSIVCVAVTAQFVEHALFHDVTLPHPHRAIGARRPMMRSGGP